MVRLVCARTARQWCAGIADHQRVYGPGVERVCRAAGLPIPPLQDPDAIADISQQMEQIVYLFVLLYTLNFTHL
jgi:hypothetical protein